MKCRRTLVVTSTFPQYEDDDRGVFLRRHWEREVARGEDVSVLAPKTAWTDARFRPGVRMRRFWYAPRRVSSLTGHFGILENIRERPWRACLVPAYVWALHRAVARELEEGSYDRVAAHFWLPSGLVAARLCAGRIPFELYGHGTDVDIVMASPAPLRAAIAKRLARASVIHVPSTRKRDAIIEALGWHHIAHKVRVEHMSHTITMEGGASPRELERDYILFLGRLIDQKGVSVLLEAASEHPGLCVVIAGDGPLRASLERRAEELSVDARFVGWVQGAAKRALIRDADAVVVPSRAVRGLSEGAPLVVAEAHAMGRPIVASDVGGIAELAASIGAKPQLVPPDDSAALAQVLGRLH